MSDGTLQIPGYSTFDVRIRAVRAVIEDGLTVTDVAEAYGTDRSTIHRWLSRFADDGENGLERCPVPGRPRKLAGLDTDALLEMVLAPATEFGYETDFWTTRRLIQVIDSRFGVSLSKQTVMRRLHEAGLSYQKPERQYFELSEAERDEWRRVQVPKIRRAVRQFKAILYFQDEANVSLTALLGKTWGVRGYPPKQRVTGKRGGVSALSAITSRGQLIFRLHDKRVASDEVIIFLGDCIDRGPDSRGAIEQLLALGDRCQVVTLLGNHEQMLFAAMESRSELLFWLKCGGQETLNSYGDRGGWEIIPTPHVKFFKGCRRFHETETHIFVHANYKPDMAMECLSSKMLYWQNIEPDRAVPHFSRKTVVVGHTPQKSGSILDLGFLLCIDTDCWNGGWLTGLEVSSGDIWQANQAGDVRVREREKPCIW